MSDSDDSQFSDEVTAFLSHCFVLFGLLSEREIEMERQLWMLYSCRNVAKFESIYMHSIFHTYWKQNLH